MPRPPFLPPLGVLTVILSFLTVMFVRDWRLGLVGVAILVIGMVARLVLWLRSSHSEWTQERFRREREVSANLFRRGTKRN